MNKKIKQYLYKGNVHSALKYIDSQINDDNEVMWKEKDLISQIHGIMNLNKFRSTFTKTEVENLSFPCKSENFSDENAQIIGKALFPTIGDCRLFEFEVLNKPTTEHYDESVKKNFSDESKMEEVLQPAKNLIQKLIKNKISVLNWGHFLKLEDFLLPKFSENDKLNFRIDGNSFSLALNMAFISFVLNKPIPTNFAFSGSVLPNGKINPVEGVDEKIDLLRMERPKVNRFVISNDSTISGSEDILVKAERINDVCKLIWEKDLDQLVRERIKLDSNLGVARIRLEKGKNDFHILNFESDDSAWYDEFPVDFPIEEKDSKTKGFIINGKTPNHYVGYNMPNYSNKNYIFAIREGNGELARIFYSGRGSNPEYKEGKYLTFPEGELIE